MPTSVQIGDIICSDAADAVDEYGVQWICDEVDGWGSPAGTLEVTQRSQDHGGWDGGSWLTPRVIGLSGYLVAPDHPTARDAVDRLIMAVSLDLTPLVIDESGLRRMCMVRRQDDVLCVWLSSTTVKWSAQVVAPDPRRYSADEVVSSTRLPGGEGGLGWPVTWPLMWDATVASGIIDVINDGTMPTPARFIIYGPCTGPRVTLVGTGRTLAWDLTLAPGQWLDVDCDRKTSLLNGQVSRSGAMTRRDWFELPRGHSQVAFNAAMHDPNALLTVVYRSAYQ